MTNDSFVVEVTFKFPEAKKPVFLNLFVKLYCGNFVNW